MINVAIDGPSSSGKSTIAKRISKELGYVYVDTGAMYRAIAIYYVDNNIDVNDEEKVAKHIESVNVEIIYENGEQQVLLNAKNVTSMLRTEIISMASSTVSKHACVRKKLTELQQKLASVQNVVMDGRDIGTVVLPNANVKVFLTASSFVRAERRYRELLDKGMNVEFPDIKKDIESRDLQDSTRKEAPLRQAEDAILIDSTNMTIEEVSNLIMDLIKEKL